MQPSNSNRPAGFDGFGLHKSLIRGIREAGFDTPREIQAATIPAAKAGRDVLGLAQTGTGKTAAFVLPILDRIAKNADRDPGNRQNQRNPRNPRNPRALILAPTRELATQIASEIRTLSKFTKIRMVVVYGGIPAWKQIQAVRQKRPEIIVACPGRLLDLVGQREMRLDSIETLVLDEADHMFDMGFLPDVRRILSLLPAKRQNLLFSATMPGPLRKLADTVLSNPHVVKLADSAPADSIDHALHPVEESKKRDLLHHILAKEDCGSAIVFTRTKHRAKRLAHQLSRAGHRAVGLQGNMSQAQRDRAMNGFRSRRFDILVATDIAARGIDVSNVTHVINYDAPNTPLAYTHRIGRTGRSEATGIARTFVTAGDRGWIRDTERMIGEAILREHVEGFGGDVEAVSTRPERTNSNGKSKPRGRRRSNNRSNHNDHAGRRRTSRGRSA